MFSPFTSLVILTFLMNNKKEIPTKYVLRSFKEIHVTLQKENRSFSKATNCDFPETNVQHLVKQNLNAASGSLCTTE